MRLAQAEARDMVGDEEVGAGLRRREAEGAIAAAKVG